MYKLLLILFTFILTNSVIAQSKTEDLKAEIRKQQKAAPYEMAEITMDIYNDRGQKRTRIMESWQFTQGDISLSLIKFKKPASVKKTGLLTIRYGEEQSQKLYLPALKKIQSIGSSQSGDSFMNSDFTYEDLGQFNTTDLEWSIISEDDEKWNIHAYPNESKQYDSLGIVISKKYKQPVVVNYYKKNDRIKELTFSDWKEIQTDIWRASAMEMKNLKKGSKTELSWNNRSFDKIPMNRFSDRYLRR